MFIDKTVPSHILSLKQKYIFNFQKVLTVSETGSEYMGSASSPLVLLAFPSVGTGTPTGSPPAGTPAAGST